MPLLSQKELSALAIQNFIFHVVQHGGPEPILLDDTPIGAFAPFFLDRVSETLRGNRFTFVDSSSTCALLRSVADDPGKFVEVSKTLARDFHSRQDKRIKAGVLIFMRLRAGNRVLFSLIKFDHEEVVSYELIETRAILRAISNSFTKSPDALHKSALIELTKSGGNLVVIDRTVRAEITEFFKGFLSVKRKYDRAEMTKEVQTVVVDTVKEYQDHLPGDITRKVRDRFYELAQRRDNFEPDRFISEFFGAHGTDELRESFGQRLEKKGLDGEVFRFDKDAVPRPSSRRYRTAEGVKLEWPKDAEETVKIDAKRDGSATITVRTKKLVEL